LGLSLPDQMEIEDQVRFCWQRWPEGEALVVLDDVTDYQSIEPYLPPADPRFKLLITTRLDLGRSVQKIAIEELDEDGAIALLESLMGVERVRSQLVDAQALCKWVGYLPLALELLGRFLARKLDWSIDRLLKALEDQRLDAKALVKTENGMTGQLGVVAALELSWKELNEAEHELACMLGMFAIAPIPWSLVEACQPEVEPDDLEDIRDDGLMARSLLKRVGEDSYQLHQIMQEYFRIKLGERVDQGCAIKNIFCEVMSEIAKTIKPIIILDEINGITDVIIHLEEIAKYWVNHILEEKISLVYIGIGRFHISQGNYFYVEPYYIKCYQLIRERIGSGNPSAALITHNLALLYKIQGRYEESEELYREALTIREKILGEEHLDIAQTLNNLGAVCRSQGKYEEAKDFLEKALYIRLSLLGEKHISIAKSLNNLANVYRLQKRYEDAKLLFLKALKIRKSLLGDSHRLIATSLNNLALLYSDQEKYKDAEQLFLAAIKMREKILGNWHPKVALSKWCLGTLYQKQGRCSEAESLYCQALSVAQSKLGLNHPHTQGIQNSLNSLPQPPA
jgi:tetratricopeptide (TPR) repeat protein